MTSKKPRAGSPDTGAAGHSVKSGAPKSKAEGRGAAGQKTAAQDADDELEEALEQTFPASDPIAMQSTLVPGSRH